MIKYKKKWGNIVKRDRIMVIYLHHFSKTVQIIEYLKFIIEVKDSKMKTAL